MIQQKPEAKAQAVLYVDIPHTSYAVRIFDGGMGRFAQYCIDFFDLARGVAINTPRGYKIYPLNNPLTGAFAPGAPLISWEQAMRVASIPAGSEKFSVPEGSQWKIVRPNEEDICFTVPFRNAPNVRQIVPRAG